MFLSIFWFASSLAQAALLCTYWQRGTVARYPWFGAMLLLGAGSPLLMLAGPTNRVPYAWAWLVYHVLLTFLRIVAALETVEAINGSASRRRPIMVGTLFAAGSFLIPAYFTDWKLMIGIRSAIQATAGVLFFVLASLFTHAKQTNRPISKPLSRHISIFASLLFVEVLRRLVSWWGLQAGNHVAVVLMVLACANGVRLMRKPAA